MSRIRCLWVKQINSITFPECIMGPEFFDFGFGPYR